MRRRCLGSDVVAAAGEIVSYDTIFFAGAVPLPDKTRGGSAPRDPVSAGGKTGRDGG